MGVESGVISNFLKLMWKEVCGIQGIPLKDFSFLGGCDINVGYIVWSLIKQYFKAHHFYCQKKISVLGIEYEWRSYYLFIIL